jgi:hypothetical protein
MVLLSSMMRTAAFTGRTDTVFTRIAGRQGGQWAERTVSHVYPTGTPRPYGAPSPPAHDAAASMQALTQLHERGLLTDAEFEDLRAQLHR